MTLILTQYSVCISDCSSYELCFVLILHMNVVLATPLSIVTTPTLNAPHFPLFCLILLPHLYKL